MCDPASAATVINTFAQVGGSIQEGQARRDQAEFEANQLERNAILDQLAASDARARGSVAAGRQRMATSDLIGQQRTAYAASGVSVDSGSAADVQASTRGLGEMDALTIENNAAREAWGYEEAASQKKLAATMTRKAGRQAQENALISGLTRGASTLIGRGPGGGGPRVPTYDQSTPDVSYGP